VKHIKDKVNLKAFLMILIVVTDTLITVYLIAKGLAYEANPLVNWYLNKTNLECMAFTKILGSLLLVLFILKKGKDFTKHLDWGIPAYASILILAVIYQCWILIQ
jgi:DMSO reductase anchor subunit